MRNRQRSHRIGVSDVELLMLREDLRASSVAREDVRRRRSGSRSEIVLVDDAEIGEVLASRFRSREGEEGVDGVERVGVGHSSHEKLSTIKIVNDRILFESEPKRRK